MRSILTCVVAHRTICIVYSALTVGLVCGCNPKSVRQIDKVEVKAAHSTGGRPSVPIPSTTSVMAFLPPPLSAARSASQRPATDKKRVTGGRLDTSKAIETNHFDHGLFSVVVQRVAASDVLFALARDSTLELELVGEVKGEITLNAVDQPLERILKKISRQVAIQYELSANTLTVIADVPVIRTYRIDYLNMSRSTRSRVELATQVGSIKNSLDGQPGGRTSNGSQMSIENESENQFWQTLMTNISGLIEEPIKSPDDVGTSAATNISGNLFVNRESGIVAVRATPTQHRTISHFIDEVINSSKRQVLIEATVVEVTLSDSFESGIDWRILDRTAGATLDYTQLLSGTPTAAQVVNPATSLLTYSDGGASIGDVTATLKLLQQFGDVQVLSSPKIIALNNQPAVLKVVDNRVYFTFEVDRQQSENGDLHTVVDSTVHSVPVGLVMNVTPFINRLDEVILNVRPTISRILNFAEDPSPALAGQTQVKNLIPEIQVREMESVLRVQSGEVAIIGGLMQNKVDNRNTGVPGIGRLPILGKLFSRDSKKLEKTELLVFLRPTVMKQPDFRRSGEYLRQFVQHRHDRLLMSNELPGLKP